MRKWNIEYYKKNNFVVILSKYIYPNKLSKKFTIIFNIFSPTAYMPVNLDILRYEQYIKENNWEEKTTCMFSTVDLACIWASRNFKHLSVVKERSDLS